MKYKVIHFFNDILDGLHAYNEGDEYPREGYTPTPERIANLAGGNNPAGRPLIEPITPKRRKKKDA